MRVNGLYGHVRNNDMRSALLFGGFVVAFHVMALLALIVPLAMLDPEHSPIYGWGGYFVRWVPIVSLAGALSFAVQMAWHTRVVRRRTDFRFVDNDDEPRLCRIVEPLTIAAGLPTPYVALIESPAFNAFACGIGRKNAVLVFTRGLVDGLDDEELGAVAAHEISHIVNGDTRLIAATNVWLDTLRLLQPRPAKKANKVREVTSLPVLAVVLPAIIVLIVVVCFIRKRAVDASHLTRLLIASSREFIADAEAVRLTQNPAALVSALRCIEGRSAMAGLGAGQDAMMIDGADAGPMATHPSIARRIEAIVAVTGSMALIAPTRLDTRASERRPAAGFGRRCATAAPADAALATNLNWLGLTREMTFGLIAAVAICAVLHGGDLLRLRMPSAFDQGGLRAVFAMAGKGVGCQWQGIAALWGLARPPTDCGKIDAMLAEHRGKGGLIGLMAGQAGETKSGEYDWPDGSFRNSMPPAMRVAQINAERCFQTRPYAVGDRGLHSVSERPYRRGAISLARYLASAEAAAMALASASVEKRAEAVEAYVKNRKTMVEVIHRFFGEPGLAAARDAFARASHPAAIALVREQLTDRAFVAGLEETTVAEMRLLADRPNDFVTCLARPTRRS